MSIPQRHVTEVREQLENADGPVKAAALLHLARVLAVADRDEAQRVLERGIALASAVPEPNGPPLMRQAVYLAATVSPQRAFQLMPSIKDPFTGALEGAFFTMLDHGHVADAVTYLSDPQPAVPYPFHAAVQAIGFSRRNPENKRKVLLGAVQAWRANSTPHQSQEFEELLVYCWKGLTDPEANEVVLEIVERIKADPDGLTGATFESGSKVARLSSIRESRLFAVFGIVHRLDPEFAASLCGEYEQLAAAVAVFPRGYHEECEEPPVETKRAEPAKRCEHLDYMTVSASRDLLPMPQALCTAFREPFEAALRLYAKDTDHANPNLAPKECWPSTSEFRNILYKAGQYQGVNAAKHLERIPNRDLRLLARIELIAAIAGLPKLGGLIMPPRSMPARPSTPSQIM